MSTQTSKLQLVKQANSENWSNDIHNANLQKIDDFAGLLMIDFGSKSVSAFCDALSSTMSEVANGQSVSFTVNLTDSVSPMSSGAHTGISTRSSSTRVNVILQRSGSSTNDSYLGSLTSNGWAWDKVATNSQTWSKNPSTYTSNVDANSYTTAGFYAVGISTNSPFGSNTAYGILIVFTTNLGGVHQLFLAGHNGNVYVRGRNTTNDSFSAWYKITTTIPST